MISLFIVVDRENITHHKWPMISIRVRVLFCHFLFNEYIHFPVMEIWIFFLPIRQYFVSGDQEQISDKMNEKWNHNYRNSTFFLADFLYFATFLITLIIQYNWIIFIFILLLNLIGLYQVQQVLLVK